MKIKRKLFSFLIALFIGFSSGVLTSCELDSTGLEFTLLEDGSLAPNLFTQWFGIEQAIIPAGDKQPMVMMVIMY